MDNKSIINIINSILLASSSRCCGRSSGDTCGDWCDMNHGDDDDSGGIAAVMLNEGNVTITPITGGLTNALYKVDYTKQHHHHSPNNNDKTDKTNSNNKTSVTASTTQSSLLVRIFGADGIINRDIETNTFAQLCNTTGTTTTTTTTTSNKLVHPKLDILGRFANGRLETYIPNMRPATVQDLVGDVEKSTTSAHAAMKKKKKKNDEEEDGQQSSPQLLLGLEVVRQMARLHHGGLTTTATTSSSGFTSYQQEQQHQPTLWKVINSWIYDLDIHIGNAKISNQQYCQVLHNVVTDKEEEEENDDGCNMISSYYRNDLKSYLYNEVTWLHQYVETRFSTTTTTPPSVVPFCHNDINPGNILLRNDDDDDDTTSSSSTTTTTTTTNSSSPPILMEYNQQTVCIIDYEYCDTNYAMYDMANYICEYAGGNDNGIPNYNLLPSMEDQMTLLHEYIRTRNELTTTTTTTHDGDMSCDDDNDDEVVQLLEQVQVFQMASCLLWGVWGILQYTTQIIDNDDATTFTSFDENVQSRLNGEIDVDIFDYLRYGKKRLARYRYLKHKIMMD
jgi:thiamine kinase-like enzyme